MISDHVRRPEFTGLRHLGIRPIPTSANEICAWVGFRDPVGFCATRPGSVFPGPSEVANRFGFARQFRERVRRTPMNYVTSWCMQLAGDQLTNGRDPVSVVARSLGYRSEAAFRTAFKRVMGCSPRQYTKVREGDAARTLATDAVRRST